MFSSQETEEGLLVACFPISAIIKSSLKPDAKYVLMSSVEELTEMLWNLILGIKGKVEDVIMLRLFEILLAYQETLIY